MCHGFIGTQSFTHILVSCFLFHVYDYIFFLFVRQCDMYLWKRVEHFLSFIHIYTYINTQTHAYIRTAKSIWNVMSWQFECSFSFTKSEYFVVAVLYVCVLFFALSSLHHCVLLCSGKVGRLAKVVSLLNVYVIIVILKAYCKRSTGFNLWSKRRMKRKEERELSCLPFSDLLLVMTWNWNFFVFFLFRFFVDFPLIVAPPFRVILT